MNNRSSNVERLLELLADRALFGLNAEEAAEMERLSQELPEVRLESMDQVAALVELSSIDLENPEFPADVQVKVRADMPSMRAHIDEQIAQRKTTNRIVSDASSPNSQLRKTASTSPVINRRTAMATWAGWATAAALLFALVWGRRPTAIPVASLSAAESRTQLVANANDLVRIAWTATEDMAAVGAKGDVVWSSRSQEGYMRFLGLAANDPAVNQYQLWIFDAAQDEKYPIDGGVFDVAKNAGEVIIPIAAKLAVVNPTMFAITVEKPGGVVVSARERIPLLAKLGD